MCVKSHFNLQKRTGIFNVIQLTSSTFANIFFYKFNIYVIGLANNTFK